MTDTQINEYYPGSDEDLAIEIIARFAAKSGGKFGRWKEPMKQQFIYGALWMKTRLASLPSASPTTAESKITNSLREFIGTVKFDEHGGGYIWGVDNKGGQQMIAEVRGWGAIQNLFADKSGKIDEQKAMEFQDNIGKLIADAINYYLIPFTPTTSDTFSLSHLKTAWNAFRMRGFPHNTDSYGNETFEQFISSLKHK